MQNSSFHFSKDNFNKTKLNNQVSYLLQLFIKTKKILAQKQFHNTLKQNYLKNYTIGRNSNQFDEKQKTFFKLLEQGLNMREIHRYTQKLVTKTAYLNVFLGALFIS